jgi:hypothetical protein
MSNYACRLNKLKSHEEKTHMNKLWKKLIALAVIASLMVMAVVPTFAQQNGLLTDIPVVGTLPGGGTFEGVLSITDFAFEDGQLLVSGVLEGTATVGGVVTEITQTFTDIVASLLGSGGQCSILELDLGPLNLDLLGLQVDLSAISLDITAVRGSGRLLGNLLCAVAGLLDAGGPLDGILGLLDQINNLL